MTSGTYYFLATSYQPRTELNAVQGRNRWANITLPTGGYPRDFDLMRREVESAADGQWTYSGGADLVLANVWIGNRGEPQIDWQSVQSGTLSNEPGRNIQSVVEAITRDLEQDLEDEAYGVGAVTRPAISRRDDGTAKKVMIGALGGIAAAIGKVQIGL